MSSTIVLEGGGWVGIDGRCFSVSAIHPQPQTTTPTATIMAYANGSDLTLGPVRLSLIFPPVPVDWPIGSICYIDSNDRVIINFDIESGYTTPSQLVVITPHEFACNKNPIAKELIEVKKQASFYDKKKGWYYVTKSFVNDNTDPPIHLSKEYRDKWIFDSEESFNDWAISIIES